MLLTVPNVSFRLPGMSNAIDNAARACGGLAKLAHQIGASAQAVSNWRTRGAPVEHCAAIEAAAGGSIRRWHLRPADWHRIWPELIGTEGAPTIDPDRSGTVTASNVPQHQEPRYAA